MSTRRSNNLAAADFGALDWSACLLMMCCSLIVCSFRIHWLEEDQGKHERDDERTPPKHLWRLPPRRSDHLRWVGRVRVRDSPDQTGELVQRLWLAHVGHDDGHHRVGHEGGDGPVEVLHLGVDGEV